MKLRLFNEYEAFTPAGHALAERVAKLIRPELKDMLDLGFSMRDVQLIIESEVNANIAEMVLKAAVTARKAERSKDTNNDS